MTGKANMSRHKVSQYIKRLPSLVLYAPLDESSGSTVSSKVGVGTVNGATLGTKGLLGRAAGFNIQGDTINFGQDSSLDVGEGDFSIFFFVKHNSESAAGTQWVTKGDGTNGPYFEMANGGTGVSAYMGDLNWATEVFVTGQPFIFDDETWHMVCMTKDSTNAKLYLDGVEVDSESTSGLGSMTVAEDMYLGDTSTHLIGLMQHVVMTKSALTARQVHDLARLAGVTG